jgi:hypothetical protein
MIEREGVAVILVLWVFMTGWGFWILHSEIQSLKHRLAAMKSQHDIWHEQDWEEMVGKMESDE